MLGSGCFDSSHLLCGEGMDRKGAFPKSPMPPTRCSFAACSVPEVDAVAPFHWRIHDPVLKWNGQGDQFLVGKCLLRLSGKQRLHGNEPRTQEASGTTTGWQRSLPVLRTVLFDAERSPRDDGEGTGLPCSETGS